MTVINGSTVVDDVTIEIKTYVAEPDDFDIGKYIAIEPAKHYS